MRNADFHTEHRIVVDTEPSVVYDLVADVSRWPVIFGPTVHTRVLEHSARGDRFEIWATANGDVRCWTSRRSFDPAARCITFAQERSTPPVGYLGGSWWFEPLTGGRTEVVLTHDFSPVPHQPDAAELITRALDHNSTAELDALCTVATLPGGVATMLLTFEDSVELAGPVAGAREFVWAADRWPDRLPHVAAMKLVEPCDGVQDMIMDTRSSDGAVHTTRSIRVGLPDRSIAYKQTTVPKPLLGHSGVWEFVDGATGATMRSWHTVLIDPAAAEELLGPGVALEEAARRVRRALGSNSMITMEHASRYSASAGGLR
jgi:aromatase